MKTISEALNTHLGTDTTTLAVLWKLKRQDNTIMGFTTHDQDLIFDAADGDGAITYYAATGFTNTASETKADLSVDNMNVTGFLESDSITEADVRAGLYDNAVVEIRIVNWADLTMGALLLRTGTTGIIKMVNGQFQAEIRGLTQKLSTVIGSLYGPLCRAELGSGHNDMFGNPIDPSNHWKCGVDLASYRQSGTVASSADAFHITPSAGLTSRVVGSFANPDADKFSVLDNGTKQTPANALEWENLNYHGWQWRTHPTDYTPRDFGYLWAHDFGFAIPSDAVISGIEVKPIVVAQSATTGTLKNVSLYSSGAAYGAAKSPNVVMPTAVTTLSYGSSFDLWGATLTPAIVNAAGFGFGVQLHFAGIRMFVFGFEMIVSYTSGGGEDAASGWFGNGIIHFTSGPLSGYTFEVKSWDGTVLTMYLPLPYQPGAGDTFIIEPGCNKTLSDCANKFNNIVNHRGEPFIPGPDVVLQYPNASGTVSK